MTPEIFPGTDRRTRADVPDGRTVRGLIQLRNGGPLGFMPPADVHQLRRELDALEWTTVRPGVRERYMIYRGVWFRERLVACQDCGTPYPEMFMLRDVLWRGVAPDDGCLCLPCCEVRLGRLIGPADLMETNPPVNHNIAHIFHTRGIA